MTVAVAALVTSPLVRAAETNSLRFSDVAKNADGSIRYLSQSDAIRYCADLRQRLPSERELLQLAMSRGATGTSEIFRSGYYVVNAINLDGQNDDFYYAHSGYEQAAAGVQPGWLWSSSVYRDDPTLAYGLEIFSGMITLNTRSDDTLAVRCVR
jgi:hypothetical protein